MSYLGKGHPTFNRESLYWVYKPYCWVYDHLLLYVNNGSLGLDLITFALESSHLLSWERFGASTFHFQGMRPQKLGYLREW